MTVDDSKSPDSWAEAAGHPEEFVRLSVWLQSSHAALIACMLYREGRPILANRWMAQRLVVYGIAEMVTVIVSANRDTGTVHGTAVRLIHPIRPWLYEAAVAMERV